MELFFILLTAGLLMIGGEVFLPGAILGIMGGAALLAAIGVGFATFGPVIGAWAAFGIILLVGLTLIVWVKFFPKTRLGRGMTLSTDGSAFKAVDPKLKDLLDAEGEAVTDLRPAGIAKIGGQTLDVLTEGNLIDKGSRIKVVNVESNRIVVRQL